MLFRRHPDGPIVNQAKFGIGCAFAACADDDVIDDVIALVQEPRHGENRAVFLKKLAESSSPKRKLPSMPLLLIRN